MTTANDAVKLLWKSGYFRPPNYRSTKDVETKAANDFGCTYANWNTLLKRSSLLRKTRKGWIQKVEPDKYGEIKIIFVEGGRPREATKKFEDVLTTFTSDLCITDPYLNKDTLDLLEKIPGKNISLIFINECPFFSSSVVICK